MDRIIKKSIFYFTKIFLVFLFCYLFFIYSTLLGLFFYLTLLIYPMIFFFIGYLRFKNNFNHLLLLQYCILLFFYIFLWIIGIIEYGSKFLFGIVQGFDTIQLKSVAKSFKMPFMFVFLKNFGFELALFISPLFLIIDPLKMRKKEIKEISSTKKFFLISFFSFYPTVFSLLYVYLRL